jgi:hypothetical protein
MEKRKYTNHSELSVAHHLQCFQFNFLISPFFHQVTLKLPPFDAQDIGFAGYPDPLLPPCPSVGRHSSLDIHPG